MMNDAQVQQYVLSFLTRVFRVGRAPAGDPIETADSNAKANAE